MKSQTSNSSGHAFDAKRKRCAICNISELEQTNSPRLCLNVRANNVTLEPFKLTALPEKSVKRPGRKLALAK